MNPIQKIIAVAFMIVTICKGAGELQVYVRNNAGEFQSFDVSADATVADLEELAGVSAGALTLGGVVLQPEQLLADAGVSAEATVVVEAPKLRVQL